jgi:hypothetical protein
VSSQFCGGDAVIPVDEQLGEGIDLTNGKTVVIHGEAMNLRGKHSSPLSWLSAFQERQPLACPLRASGRGRPVGAGVPQNL